MLLGAWSFVDGLACFAFFSGRESGTTRQSDA